MFSKVALVVKNPPTNAAYVRDAGSIPGKISWSRKWQPTSVFLPGESHGQRSLASYSPQSRKELDRTEVTEQSMHAHLSSFLLATYLGVKSLDTQCISLLVLHNKIPQTGWLKQPKFIFTDLKTGSPNSRSSVSLSSLSLAGRCRK